MSHDFGYDSSVVVQSEGELLTWFLDHGFAATCNPMPWPDLKHSFKFLYHLVSALKFVRMSGSDIIHCNEHNVYPFASALNRIARKPIVCHVRYKLDRGFAEWAFGGKKCPDALLWTSYQQKQDSASAVEGVIPEERQHVVRLGIDIDRFANDSHCGRELRSKWGIRDDQIVIGLPSPFRPRKRIHEFIQVMQRLVPTHSNVVGVIAGGEVPGDETYLSEMKQLIAGFQPGEQIRWVGHLDDVAPFHHACDISVSTSEYETFGNSVCEAMACGKPVAGYRGGSIGEVLGETGFVVETGDLDGLTQAIDQLILKPELRSQMGQRAKERVATEFNPRKSFEQLVQIYEQLLSSRAK